METRTRLVLSIFIPSISRTVLGRVATQEIFVEWMNSKDVKVVIHCTDWPCSEWPLSAFQKGKRTQGRSSSTSSFLLTDRSPVPHTPQQPPFLPCNFQTTKLDSRVYWWAARKFLLVSGEGVGDKERKKARKWKLVECLESVTYSLFNPQKPLLSPWSNLDLQNLVTGSKSHN